MLLMAAMKNLVWNPFLSAGLLPSFMGSNDSVHFPTATTRTRRAAPGGQRGFVISMARTRTPRRTSTPTKEAYRSSDARRLSFTEQRDAESEKFVSVGVSEPLVARSPQPEWMKFGSVGVVAGMVVMGIVLGNRMVDEKSKQREGGSVKRLRERNLIAPGEVITTGAAVGYREVRPLTQDKIEAARQRRKKDGHWERPVYIQEGQPVPEDVDPSKVIVITHNHPFAHAKVEDTIPMDVIRRRVMQFRGVPEAQQKAWEAIQRRAQTMPLGPTRLPKETPASDDPNARMNDRFADRAGMMPSDDRQGVPSMSDNPSGSPWDALNGQRGRGQNGASQADSQYWKEGRAGQGGEGIQWNGRSIR